MRRRPLPPVDEALGLQREGLFELVLGGVAETRELGARPRRAWDPAHPSVAFLCRFGAFLVISALFRACSLMQASMP